MEIPMTQPSITDPDVKLLAAVSASLRPEYVKAGVPDPWSGSPFEWIKTRPSRQVGKIAEQLVAGWSAARNLNVMRSPDSEADRIIEGVRVEIKASTLWASGSYRFQQIRGQDYEVLALFGLSPFDAHLWIVDKALAWKNTPGQHTGAGGRDTHWIEIRPGAAAPWIPGTGRLVDAYQRFRALGAPRAGGGS